MNLMSSPALSRSHSDLDYGGIGPILRCGSAQNITPENFQAECPGAESRVGKGRRCLFERDGTEKDGDGSAL